MLKSNRNEIDFKPAPGCFVYMSAIQANEQIAGGAMTLQGYKDSRVVILVESPGNDDCSKAADLKSTPMKETKVLAES
jgi:hypothetical protein